MIVDTSALLAYFDVNEPRHEAVSEVIDSASGPFVVSPYIVAEVDYLVLTRHGSAAEHAVLEELTSGAWELAPMDRGRLAVASRVVARYVDVPIGVADASNIVLAQDYHTTDILTLDRRHFAILRFDDGTSPRVLP
ncbi:MAG: PIN domain-containing protein [Austwickia sp.]|nr:PIN domain-containing protein [Austwickia sp.]